jgi:hypothetical protein
LQDALNFPKLEFLVRNYTIWQPCAELTILISIDGVRLIRLGDILVSVRWLFHIPAYVIRTNADS